MKRSKPSWYSRLFGGPQRPDPIFGARPRHELEFLPAALEVVETPAPPLPRIAALSMVALMAAVLGWACLSQLDVVSTAAGKIVPAGGSKVIQPLEEGAVKAIHVQDGETVHKGEVLVELETTETAANQRRARGELASASLDAARLRSVALGDRFSAPRGADPRATAIAAREAAAEIEERNGKLRGLADDIDRYRAALGGVRAEMGRLEALLPLAEQRVKVFQGLAESGYGSKLQLIEAEEKAADTGKSLEVQRQKAAELQNQISAAQRALDEARGNLSKTALGALSEATTKSASLAQELDKANERQRARTLVAPVDGTVQELAIHTIGGVVAPGQTLMRIAPAAHEVEVEAKLANRDVGFVRAGMAAAVKVQTFPFTRYGVLHGVITSVSRDALSEARPPTDPAAAAGSIDDLRYLIRVRLARATMMIDGLPTPLTPGMEVSVEIRTGRRRLIDYILSPLQKAASESGHER